MPAKRLSMRKIKDVLRLCWGQGLSKRKAARSCGVSRPAVDEYLRRAEAAGLCWPLPAGLDDGALERLLFPPPPVLPAGERGVPDWSHIHQELKRKGVTLFLLWQEYRQRHPHGYQYTWFCQHYRTWCGKLDLVMRQTHQAGEKLFVDYAGMRVVITDPSTGEVREAEVFVAALGASNYTYAEATWSQGLEDWIGAHVRCFAYLGGVPELVVPNNLRAGVSKAHRYEPDINPTYQDMATHYGVAILPARVRRPRDKSKAEVAVQVVERWILARAAPPSVLLTGGLEPCHRCTADAPQQSALQETAGYPARAVRATGPTGPAAPAHRTLCVCRVETGARTHRLSRRSTRSLLLRAPRAGQKATGRAHHPPYH